MWSGHDVQRSPMHFLARAKLGCNPHLIYFAQFLHSLDHGPTTPRLILGMNLLRAALLFAVFGTAVALVGAATPALAADSPGRAKVGVARGSEGTPSGRAIEPTILWTVAGVAVGVVVFGTLYLLKRQVAAFPKNPTWVAPISIMPSRELPDETKTGDNPAHVAPGHH